MSGPHAPPVQLPQAPATWVLLRGLTREAGHWGTFPKLLAQRLRARVLTPDLPGNGVLHGQCSPLHVDAMVASVRQQLQAQRAIGEGSPVGVLALSLGAMVALAWARQQPQELAGCVLVNTSLRGISPLHQRLSPRAWPVLLSSLLRGDDAARETAILRLTSRQVAAVPPHWLALCRAHPVSRANALRQLLAAARSRAAAEPPPVPLLLLASQADALVDPACSQALARHWSVPLALHPGAGHDLPLDDGSWVAAQVARWLTPP